MAGRGIETQNFDLLNHIYDLCNSKVYFVQLTMSCSEDTKLTQAR